jgi:hypothetical protein
VKPEKTMSLKEIDRPTPNVTEKVARAQEETKAGGGSCFDVAV